MNNILRFAIVLAMAIALATPATALSRPDDVSANPARQPVFHRTQASGAELGTLRIPAIGLDETIRSGVAMSVIDQGVAHWSGTANAGEQGNMVLAGHRSTKTMPFEDLDKLEPGDLI
ncbi:MAG: class E sortase, partial [Actinomycetota bacterium]